MNRGAGSAASGWSPLANEASGAAVFEIPVTDGGDGWSAPKGAPVNAPHNKSSGAREIGGFAEMPKKTRAEAIDPNSPVYGGESGSGASQNRAIKNSADGAKNSFSRSASDKNVKKTKKRGDAASPGETNAPYRFPPLAFLDDNPDKRRNFSKYKAQTQEVAMRLEEILLSFKVRARVINVTRGPSVTQYEVQPDVGVKVNTVVNLAEDISLKLGVTGIRITPVAERTAIAVEVPNSEVSAVVLRDIVGSDVFLGHQSQLAFAVGVDISGEAILADISKMPHLLIAGATGSGKSIFVNCLILSLLYKSSPDDVKLIMIDPKVVELGVYNGIPHLMIPVVTDPRKAAGALAWAVQEMLSRYQAFSEKKVKDLAGFNAYAARTGEGEKLPRIVIIIDELADLMMAAPKEVQDSICRLAQMARAAGMHLVVATQRPTVDVITGLIKSNIPSRIAFRVASQTDSRVILDTNGAEKLLGRGDMLFYPVGEKKPLRVQGAFISEAEMERVIDYIKIARETEYDEEMIDKITGAAIGAEDNPGDNDELLPNVIEHVVDAGLASTSMIQRKFKVGYARAARIIDQMEARGIVSGFDGSKPRHILITKQQLYEMRF
jgi:S-DNA-T family DNA segregation ATPase FtsK/SpoIIIE